jgi:MarR family transcriptional regulator, organic hydroperoxide resistance regulator
MTDTPLSSVARELRQSRPFPTLDAEVLVALMHTSDRVRGHLTADMAPFGVTLQQYNVLRILRGAGPDGLPTLAIGERMIERTPGVTRLLDRLERQGLISRVRGEDRRQVIARVTPAGLELLDDMEEPLHGANARLMSHLDEAEARQLLELLSRVRTGAAGGER